MSAHSRYSYVLLLHLLLSMCIVSAHVLPHVMLCLLTYFSVLSVPKAAFAYITHACTRIITIYIYKYNIHTIQHTRRLLSATGGNGGQLQVDGAFLGAVDALERHCIEHNAQLHKDHPQVKSEKCSGSM